MNIQIVYRLSDNSYPQKRFQYASKIYCLMNFLKFFPASQVHLLIDKTNLKKDTIEELYNIHNRVSFAKLTIFGMGWDAKRNQYEPCGSSAASWRMASNYAIDTFLDTDYVYFVEDDYLHREGSYHILQEGLEISHYVSLYDHFDKYVPMEKGGNHAVQSDGGEITKVYVTKSSHWKLTNSTTMTFATSMKNFKNDFVTWEKYTHGNHPNDYGCFLDLQNQGKSLITPLPGYSTHCMEQWASPIVDWKVV